MSRLLFAFGVVAIVFSAAVQIATAQGLTADDYIEFWQPMVGTWEGTFELNGETNPITFRFRISRNKKCILLYHEVAGKPGTQQLQAYNPVTKKEIAWGVDKDGNRQIQTIAIDGMAKGKRAAKGVGGSWELRVLRNDGTTSTTVSEWSFTQLDEKQSAMVWSNVVEDGVAKPDTKLTLERQPDGSRRGHQ